MSSNKLKRMPKLNNLEPLNGKGKKIINHPNQWLWKMGNYEKLCKYTWKPEKCDTKAKMTKSL